MKTSEMIAMLENNPKLRFRRKGWDVLNQQVGLDKDNFVGLWQSDGRHLGVCLFTNQDDWELVQQPVTFAEAMAAFAEGKVVRVEDCPGNVINCNVCSHRKSQVFSPRYNLHICLSQVKGKWYIDE